MTDKYQRIRDALAMGPTQGPYAVNPERAFVEEFGTGEPLPICAMLWPTEQRSEDETVANALLFASCDPDTIRGLLAERDGLIAQHHRDSAELRRICDARDQSRRTAEHWKAEHLAGNAEIERLRGENEALQVERDKLCSIISDIKDWDCDVSGGFLSIPVGLRRRMQDALAAYRQGGGE